MSTDKSSRVILNGDDFGCSPGVNRGIMKAIDDGILTSTSVMVKRAAASEAAQLVRKKKISVGLHLDMTEEGYRRWLGLLGIFFRSSKEIEHSFNSQIDEFVRITGQLPDHIDGHHNIHVHPRVKPYVVRFSKEHKIPVRGDGSAKFIVSFFGRSLRHWNDPKKVSAENLIKIIEGFKPGTYEIMCHPGYVDGELLKSRTSYLKQRQQEVKALTSKKLKDYLADRADIRLINWQDL